MGRNLHVGKTRGLLSKFLSWSLLTSLFPVIVAGTLVSSSSQAIATGYTTIPLETATATAAVANSQPGFVELGALASRSRSTVAVKKSITRSTVSPYIVTGTDSLSGLTYQYQTLQAYSGNNLYESMDVTSNIVAAGGPGYGLGSKSWSFSSSATYDGRSGVNRLTSSMASIPRTSGQAPYGSVFGPEVWSTPFVGQVGKSVSFDWAAANGQDDYEIYAFVVKVDPTTVDATCSQVTTYGTDDVATPGVNEALSTHTLAAYGRGLTQTWITASSEIPSNGCYRFRFVSGTYDQTGGLAVGASLYVDNTVLIGDTQKISFPAIADRLKDSSNPIVINANASAVDVNQAAINGATLAYTSLTQSVCTVNSSTGAITIATNNTGTCTISVNSPAFGTYAAASPVSVSFRILASALAPSAQGNGYISGTAESCATLTAVLGTWNDGTETITATTYQWQVATTAGGTYSNISGATNSTYLVASSDLNKYIKVVVTRTNSVGSGTETYSSLLISTQGSSCAAPSSPVNVVPAFRIEWATNTGTGYMNPQYAYMGSTVVLDRNLYKKDGFSFAGWNTKADGTATAYADGASFKIDSSDVILYAQWKLIQTKPTITWATPIAIQEGTALGATQLNALASVPGTYTYAPAAAAILAVGKHTLKVTFVPTDAKYETIETTVEIEVLAKAKLTWANPAAIVEGTALGATQLNALGSVPGSYSYSPAAGTTLPVGKNTLKVVFTPTDTRLSAVTAEVSIEVTAVIPAPPLSPNYTVTGNPKSTITWGAGANAATYTVSVDGKNACSVAALSCEVAKLLGPKSVVTVTSVAAGGRTSAAVPAAYVAPSSPQVLTVVNFDSARAVLKSSETAKLRTFASQIKSAGFTSLTVFGHTDSVGGVDNKKLSVSRANSTITYLKKLLPGVKFVLSGFAAGEPVADNSTPEGKAANRRAEVFIP